MNQRDRNRVEFPGLAELMDSFRALCRNRRCASDPLGVQLLRLLQPLLHRCLALLL